ncbi:hypothetical protein AOLI_G00240880 [Acnodon oligacanthus]
MSSTPKLEVTTKMKEKMEKLEHERDIRDPIAAIKESEDWILSLVTLLVIKKHRLMHELQKRVNAKYKAMMKEMEELERQREIRDPVAAIKEDRILSAVTLVVIKKH